VVRKLALTVLVLISSTLGVAAQPAASQKNRKAAATHFLAGKQHYEAKRYQKATAEYRAAYELAPEPALLFNIGLALEAAGELADAIQSYRRYVGASPNGDAAPEARRRIERLEKTIKEQPMADPKQEKAQPQPNPVVPPPSSSPRAGPDPVATPPGAANLTRKRSDEPSNSLLWPALVTGAAGAVALGFGIKTGFDVRSLSSDLSEGDGAWTAEEIADFDRGETLERRAIILSAAGGAALVTGAILFFVGAPDDRESPRLQTQISENGVGFGIAMGF
jgi:tetratricopeptide (TPR) repeat protein